MNHLFSKGGIWLIVAVSLANLSLPVLQAKPRCPGGAPSVTPRFAQRALIVIPVNINQAGPFDFMVDTGSQMGLLTIVDVVVNVDRDLCVGLLRIPRVVKAPQAQMRILHRSPLSSSPLRAPKCARDLGSRCLTATSCKACA